MNTSDSGDSGGKAMHRSSMTAASLAQRSGRFETSSVRAGPSSNQVSQVSVKNEKSRDFLRRQLQKGNCVGCLIQYYGGSQLWNRFEAPLMPVSRSDAYGD